ncbi:hypothetical protein AK830_g903 [Neonectria ditissima]|uniref:Nicotinamide-nucleotide adenylyltransferase n=1 Tax=Neonectria ditissima TaxID=78410 RepID=A0A0P7BVQ9_9HYPO|nr:hypothetical protein AK830_g903 [Neonectria ditissima]
MHRPDPKSLVSFFSRALTSFQSSSDAFRVLCTLPHANDGESPAPRRPAGPVSNLVVLDSSFNPPTRAHASMARAALKVDAEAKEGTRRLVLLLSVNNADKAPKPASFPVRLGMMDAMGRQLLEATGTAGVEIDVAVTTLPYFHDKARAMAQAGVYGTPPTTTFLAGFDTLERILDGKYYGGAEGMQRARGPFFAGGARLRVTARGGGGTGAQRAWAAREAGEWAARVEVVEAGAEEDGVSSSRVREVVRQGGGGVREMVGEEVEAWIEREGLYRG